MDVAEGFNATPMRCNLANEADVTGEVLHTYTFRESWDPQGEPPVEWSPTIRKILRRDNVKAR